MMSDVVIGNRVMKEMPNNLTKKSSDNWCCIESSDLNLTEMIERLDEDAECSIDTDYPCEVC